jgi:hypothetical protein
LFDAVKKSHRDIIAKNTADKKENRKSEISLS